VPSQHKHPAAVYRPDPELHRRARIAAEELGLDMNAAIIAFLRWLVRDTDKLPLRPAEPAPATPPGPEPGGIASPPT